MIVVRPIGAQDDATAAGRLVQQAYFALPNYPRDVAYDAVLGDVAGRVHQATVLVAVDTDADIGLVGCLTYVPQCPHPLAEHTDCAAASFRCFGVRIGVHGRGVGRAMVAWCVAQARRDGKLRLRIHTLTMMASAQQLYSDMGFVRDPSCDANWDGVIGWAYVLHL